MQRIYFLSYLLLVLFLPNTLQAATAENADTNISITLPEVVLLDVSNPSTSFTLVAPTNAGEGFSTINAVNNTATLEITSNIPDSKLYAKTDKNLPIGLALTVSTNGIPGHNSQLVGVTSSDTLITPIGSIKTNSAGITLSTSVSNTTGGMAAHGTTNLKVIYTITKN